MHARSYAPFGHILTIFMYTQKIHAWSHTHTVQPSASLHTPVKCTDINAHTTHKQTHDNHNHIEPVVKPGLIVWATRVCKPGKLPIPSDKKENELVEKCAGFFIVIDQTRSGRARGKPSLSKGRERERGRGKPHCQNGTHDHMHTQNRQLTTPGIRHIFRHVISDNSHI